MPVGVQVHLGEYSLQEDSEALPVQKRVVTRIHMHPYYRFSPQADRYDIAVLRLDRPVQYAPHILPICLPKKNQIIDEHTPCMVSGWGARDPSSSKRPRQLQAVNVNVVDSKRCEDWHKDNKIDVKYFSMLSSKL